MTTIAPTADFRINAYFLSSNGLPSHLKIEADVKDVETAQAIVATFPKSYGASAHHVVNGGECTGLIQMRVNLEANRNHGAKNETGIKRYRAFAAKAAKLGHTVTFAVDMATNAYQSQATLDAALDA